jgi:hypothetical protein
MKMSSVRQENSALVEWDISGLDFKSMKGGQSMMSSKFPLLGSGLQATLSFFPKGFHPMHGEHTSLFLSVKSPAKIMFSLRVDESETQYFEKMFDGDAVCGKYTFSRVKEKYKKVTLMIHEVEIMHDSLKQRFVGPCVRVESNHFEPTDAC